MLYITVLISVIIAASAAVSCAESETADSVKDSVSASETVNVTFDPNEFVRLYGKENAKNGLTGTTLDMGLNKEARVRVQELPAKFAHFRPNGEAGVNILKGIVDEKAIRSEILMKEEGILSSEEVFEFFNNNSAAHNFLFSGKEGQFGIGVFYEEKDGEFTTYAVLLTAEKLSFLLSLSFS